MALATHPLLAAWVEYGYAIPIPFLRDYLERDVFLFIYLPV